MKSIYTYITALLVILLVSGCNNEITLVTSYEPQIFIFGNLTNDARSLKITIQESVPVEDTTNESKPVNNAKIVLFTEDSNGEKAIVTDEFIEHNGEYQSIPIISPTLGNYYWIEVELEDGTTYRSEKEQLKPLVYIDKISKENGFIRATFKDPANERNFYRLEITTFEGDFEDSTYLLSSDILFNGNSDAFIEESIGLSGNTAHATLMSFNYNTYQFYLNVSAQEDAQLVTGEGGDPSQLFAPPPVHLTGNITNTKTKRKALGNFGVVSVNSRDQGIASVFPQEINNLIYYFGNEQANTVIVNTQGGPQTQLATRDFKEVMDLVGSTVNLLKVNVHQAQTIHPQSFNDSEITFQQAEKFDAESVEMLYKVIKYFKDQGKTVYVLGISFGAFMTEELIAKKGIDLADKYLIMVGRLDMDDILWKWFSEGDSGYFENGVKPIRDNATSINEKNMNKLAAGLGQNRYTKDLDKYQDLSKVTYIYGKKDKAVGRLTNEELQFLKSKKVTIISGLGGHSETIDGYIKEGFKVAFGIE